jgi:hypothetical protein
MRWLLLVVASVAACSHQTASKRNPISTFSETAPVQTSTPPPPPLAGIERTDPTELALLLASAAAAPNAFVGQPSAHPEPAEEGVRKAAPPDMTGGPDVGRATLLEGQHTEMNAQLDAGKCYAIIAYGAGVADLELTLLTPPFFNLIAGQEHASSPTAIINKICPVPANAGAYRLDIYAKKGGGTIAAQIYSRAAK